ncbi:UNVERIFIED_ORG: hemagglutinin repeat-containing protein [Shinella sp. XGS7]|nr:hemagglutinin repeat-containing protein [Shinella sp. XGS7]
MRGSTVQAAGKTRLQAEDQINILAAQNTTQESNSQSSKSGSVGVGINLGAGGLNAGVTVSASRGTGQGAGNGSTYSNSQISGSQVTLESGGDTTIKGGVVQGERLIAQVGGNLNIESLQDKSQYREKSQQVGGSVTIGPSPGGSLSAGQTKINSDYLSVGEQSAIGAGDGGFNVSVQGKTELTGAQITSTQAAIDQGRNRYEAKQGTTTTDLQNSASYSAQSASVGVAAGTPAPGKSLSAGLSGVGIGSDSGSASSTSTAGISGVAGDLGARTGDKEAGLKPIFDKDKARQEVNAQVAITSEFGKQASKAVGDYAKQQHDKAKEAGDKDGMAAWEEGGKNRVALHVLVGGLTGGVQGAVGAGAASVAAPSIDALQSGLQSALKDAGLGDSAANLISGLAGGATAATIGAAASGGSTAGAATAFNADMNNRQLHPPERQLAQQLAKKSGGKYTVQQIEDAMRNSGNSDLDENVTAGMLVDPNKPGQIYDTGAAFTSYDGKKLVQANRDGRALGTVDPGLAAFIRSNTGGGGSPYTAFAPIPAMPDGGVASNGQRYEMRSVNGQSFSVPVANCPAVSCQNGDNIARHGLSPEDQKRVDAYQAAMEKQSLKDVSTIGLVAATAPMAGSGLVANMLLGGAAGGAISAKDQFIDKRQVDTAQTLKDAGIAAGATAAMLVAAPAVLGGVKAYGQALDDVANIGRLTAEAEASARAAVKARVELNARADDAQQYVNNNAPIQVPNTVTRNDNDFSSAVNYKGNPKAHTDENGNLVAANPNGTASATTHVRGSDPANTPWISTTDVNAVDPALGGPKLYGSQQTTINARDLQRDINAGTVSQDIKIVTNQQLVKELQVKVDAAQKRFDANPSDNNLRELKRAQETLDFGKRDGECLIKVCVPAPYLTPPAGLVTPIVPLPKLPTTPSTPSGPSKPGS